MLVLVELLGRSMTKVSRLSQTKWTAGTEALGRFKGVIHINTKICNTHLIIRYHSSADGPPTVSVHQQGHGITGCSGVDTSSLRPVTSCNGDVLTLHAIAGAQ